MPVGFSPQVCTDMKAQFLKPLEEVSLSLSAKSTVVVPEWTNTVFYTCSRTAHGAMDMHSTSVCSAYEGISHLMER